MSILSTSSKLIKVGQDYIAGSGISIDDHVISVTGEFGKTYSAGQNVDIYEQDEQLYISSKDWTDEIAEASANAYNAATAQIPDPFDPSYLSAQIDNKLNSSDFTTWQNGQYNTDLQTIEGQINNKLDTSSFSEVSGSFLTAINIPESATWNEVSQAYEQASGTYLTSHQSLEGYATQDWVKDQGYLTGVSIPESAVWQDVSTTVQTNSAQWAEGGTGDEEVNSFVYDNSATILDVDTTYQQNSATYLTSHQDISNKLDTTAFSTVSGEFLTAAPADMATTGDIAELAQTVSETYQVKGDYLTTADSANFYPANNPSSFATEDWVTAQGYITGVDLSNYYTKDETSGKEELANAFANVPAPDYEVESYIHNNSASIDESTGVVQSNSSTWSDVTVYQSNSGSYLTGVEIPESATWNEVSTTVQTNSSVWDNVTNKLDSTAFNLPDSATWNEVSTAYQNASATYLTAHQAISADEWNDCYDNVNTNSGAWGGEALPISAGPGIKVNLVDNTLVFSNDETVLWEDTPSSAISISEPFSNFETIKIYAYAKEQNSGMARTFEFPGTNRSFDFHIFDYNMEGTAVVNYLTRYVINGMDFSASVTNHWWQTIGAVTGGTWSGPGSNPIVPIKVIGINRIAGGN